MSRWTEPLRYCRSLSEIDGEYLKSMGIGTILVDLDNTLVYWHTRDCLPGASEWLEARMREGFRIFLFSNASRSRSEAFAREHGIRSLPYAGKPWPFALPGLRKSLGTPKDTWVMVGDQIFTDVLFGGVCGIRSLYVFPASEHEWWWTRFVRRFERRVLKRRGVL